MKPKTLILMVVAVTCGLAASYMTSKLLAERGQAPEQETVKVLVAKKNLDTGLFFKNPADFFVEKSFIKGEEPREAIVTSGLDTLKERMLARSLRAGDFITPGDLVDHKGNLIHAQLPKGHRAVGIRVNMESIAGGWATLPGSKVDIISTVRRADDKTSFSQVLLQNVLVLGIDTNVTRDQEGRAMPGTVAIVALKPEDALKMTIAKEYGQLSLALRGFGENNQIDVSKATFDHVINNTKVAKEGEQPEEEPAATVAGISPIPMVPMPPQNAPAQAEPIGPPPNVHTITVIEGDKERRVDFMLDAQGRVIRPEVSSSPLNAPLPQVALPAPVPPAPASTPDGD